MKIINFKNDVLFRDFFSAPQNNAALISLINPIIELIGFNKINEIKILNPNLKITGINQKKPILDLRAVDGEGKMYNIEVQVSKDLNYWKRAVFYLTKMHSTQLKKGEKYSETKTCIGIHLLDFVLYPKDKTFYTTVGLTELNKSCRLHSHDLYLIYIELPKVDYRKGKLNTLKKWLYFIENVHKKEDTMIQKIRKEIPEIDQAARDYEKFIAHHELQYALQRQEMAERDYISEMSNARDRGFSKGLAEGKAKGLAEGKAKGLAEGLAEGLNKGEAKGKAERSFEIAHNLKAKNFTTSEIAEITGLSINEIEKL